MNIILTQRKSNIERHNMLGLKKKVTIELTKILLLKNSYKFPKKKRFQNEWFQNLYLIHLAYNFKLKESNIKVFLINAHIIPYVINFNSYFNNVKFNIIHKLEIHLHQSLQQ